MKEKDIAALILVTGFTLMVSWFGFGKIINTPEDRTTEVPVVNEITAQFPDISDTSSEDYATYSKIFNDKSINPTELIEIGESKSDKPFSN